jgi:hypothetical protein
VQPLDRDAAADNGSDGNGHADGAFLGACTKHYATRAVGKCDDCGEIWCSQCLVPPTRKRQPSRCIDCALVAAGVRAPGPRRSSITSVSRHQRRPTNLF